MQKISIVFNFVLATQPPPGSMMSVYTLHSHQQIQLWAQRWSKEHHLAVADSFLVPSWAARHC